jgi:hypothetical protein
MHYTLIDKTVQSFDYALISYLQVRPQRVNGERFRSRGQKLQDLGLQSVLSRRSLRFGCGCDLEMRADGIGLHQLKGYWPERGCGAVFCGKSSLALMHAKIQKRIEPGVKIARTS